MQLSTLKRILIFAIMSLSTFFAFAEDSEIKISEEDSESAVTNEIQQADSAIKRDTNGYFSFLENCINCNISVVIKDVDNSIIGKLQEVYKDGLLLETSFSSTIFIPKDSIAYIKISKMNKK